MPIQILLEMAKIRCLALALITFSTLQGQYIFESFGATNLVAKTSSTACEKVNACFELTPDRPDATGSVFNKTTLDLNYSLDLTFCVFFGNKDATGADGMAFLLKAPTSSNIGAVGAGLGAMNIDTSIVIEFDTWDNGMLLTSDIPADHTALSYNGMLNRPIIPAIAFPSGNIEDNSFHKIRFSWNAQDTTIQLFFDGTLMFTHKDNIIKDVFFGNPNVDWGFTASTGKNMNRQVVCYPDVSVNIGPDTTVCEGTPITIDIKPANVSEYLWTNIDTKEELKSWKASSGTPLNDTKLEITKPGNYALSVVLNSFRVADTIKVTHIKYPVPVMLGKSYIVCPDEGKKVTLDAGNPNYDYSWEPTNETTQSIEPIVTAKHLVTVTDKVIKKCSAKDSAYTKLYCQPVFEMPNVFTPNNDKKNDLLRPITLKYVKDFIFKLYDSWGRLKYESVNNKVLWDGKDSEGVDLPSGVYFYVATYIDTENIISHIRKNGTIHLMR